MPSSSGNYMANAPPDGGWGWVVVMGAFISIGFSYAFPKALTIYFKEIQENFCASYSEIAWISSIMLATMYGGGPLSSILVNRFGSRPVVIAGGVMCSLAMLAASFGKTIMHLYVCIGIVGGLGLSFNLQPSLTIIGKYFLVKRPLANGLAMAGSPVFLCALAPLNQFLFDHFGWRGSFAILGGLLLNCCVAGSLMRPLEEPRQENEASLLETVSTSPGRTDGEPGCTAKMNKFIDFSLFKHRGFVIYLVGNVVMFFGFFAPIVFLAPYAKHLGVSEYSSAFLLSILAIVDMFARPGTGMIANTRWIRPRIQYLFSFAVSFNGLCHLLCPLATGYRGLAIYSIFFGIAFGMVCALLFECLSDQVGAQRFSSAVGLVTIIECCPVLLGPPIAGALVDKFKDYKYMYYMCGSVMLAAGLFLFIMNFYNYKLLEQEKKQKENDMELSAVGDVRAREEEEDEEEEYTDRKEELREEEYEEEEDTDPEEELREEEEYEEYEDTDPEEELREEEEDEEEEDTDPEEELREEEEKEDTDAKEELREEEEKEKEEDTDAKEQLREKEEKKEKEKEEDTDAKEELREKEEKKEKEKEEDTDPKEELATSSCNWPEGQPSGCVE